MYEECTDVYGEESSSDAVYIGGSSSGYYETDEKAVAVYGNVGDDEPAAAPSTTDVPEFLRQDRQQQQAIEAAKLRMFYMTYRQSALFTSLSHGFEQSVGTWNQRFQTLMDMDDSFAKYDKLRSMAHDFVHAAEAYGRIIISEMCLPDDKKTVRPIALGGIAGGQKFIVQDILFKFAVDFEGLYGGDAFAMKGAGHDLAGLTAYLGAIEMRPRAMRVLHVPLMALIDFRGYRLVAICVLPIGRDTICYGSFDAGKTVHYQYPGCNAAMKEIGDALNIMGHRSAQHEHLIYAPIDIEAHLGKDQKFYVLDFARYMPPQPPSGKWGGSLYELLRPELVRQSPVPLSPDAFSNMGHSDDARVCRQAIKDIFSKLVKPEEGGIVFDYAAVINSTVSKSVSEISEATLNFRNVSAILTSQEVLVRELHSRGINMRFLGLLRSFCILPKIRLFLLGECLARLWKCELRHLWRDVMRTEKTPSAEPFRKITCRFLNLLLGDASYWTTLRTRLTEKFPGILSAEELSPEFDFRKACRDCYSLALPRLLVFLNIELEQTTHSSLMDIAASEDEIGKFEFVAGDVLDMGCRVKHMNTVDKADAAAYMYQAAELAKTKPETASRLLNLALAKLLTAMKTCGTDVELQFKFCICRVEIYKLELRGRVGNTALDLAEVALSALIKKLEEQKSPLLPTVLLEHARCRSFHPHEPHISTALELAAEAYRAYKVHAAAFVVSEETGHAVKAGLLPFLNRFTKCVVAAERGLYAHVYADLMTKLGNPIVTLFDEYLLMFQDKKFFSANPVIGLRLWWLLYRHTRALLLRVEVPKRVIAEMVNDANVFLIEAIKKDPRLETKLVKMLQADKVDKLCPYLPAGERSEEVFSVFVRLTSSWTAWQCRGLDLPLGMCFARLISASGCITKLKLNGATGVSEAAVVTMLNSSIRATLESLSLPSMLGSDFITSLEGEFPRLRGISVRNTATQNVHISHLAKLCPALTKLDVSMTLCAPDHETLWLPAGLRKLDLGFPREVWAPVDLMHLLQSEGIPQLTFLGLAGTSICDVHMREVFKCLPHLQSLDLAKTVVSERFLRSLMAQPAFTAHMTALWLPRVGWWPILQDADSLEIGIVTHGIRKLILSCRGKEAFVATRHNAQSNVFITMNPRQAPRGLHMEKLSATFFDSIDRSEPIVVIMDDHNGLLWVRDGESRQSASRTCPISRNMLPKVPPGSMHPLQLEVRFDGELFKLRGNPIPGKNKVLQLMVTRVLTNENRTLQFPPFASGNIRVAVKPFAGVSPLFWIAALQTFGSYFPVAFDGQYV